VPWLAAIYFIFHNNLMGLKGLCFLFLCTFCATAHAKEVIELPKEELARESVLPAFENAPMVKSRNVTTDGRLEFGGFYGMALTEPIANLSRLGASLYYHTSEDHAWGVLFTKNLGGLSDYAKQLYGKFGLDFNRAPMSDSALMLDYNYKMLYGKMSLTKTNVLNLSLYTSLAAGMVKYVHKSFPAIAGGLGQKVYFDKQWSFRADLRLFAHQAPIPFLKGDPGVHKDDGVPSYDRFQERLTFTTSLELGVNYLF
jgi:outer membrane beta-barrel protein